MKQMKCERGLLLLLLAAGLLFLAFCVGCAAKENSRLSWQNGTGRLADLSVQAAQALDGQFIDYQAYVQSLAGLLEASGETELERLDSWVSAAGIQGAQTNVAPTTGQGAAEQSDEAQILAASRREAAAQRGSVLSPPVELADGSWQVLATAPLLHQGQVLGFVEAMTPLAAFDPMGSEEAFGGDIEVYLLNADRRFYWDVQQVTVLPERLLESAVITQGGDTATLYAALGDGRQGIVRYERAGGDYTACLVPLKTADWAVMLQVPTKRLYQITAVSRFNRVLMLLALAGFVALCLLAVIYYMKRQSDTLAALNTELEMEKLRYQAVISCASDVLLEYYPQKDCMHFHLSPSEAACFGQTITIVSYLQKLCDQDNQMVCPEDRDNVRAMLLASGNHQREIRAKAPSRPDEDYIWMEMYCRSLVTNQGQQVVMGLLRDISDRKRRELLLKAQSEQDPMTGLLNKRAVECSVTAYIEQEHGSRRGALFFMDLDNFKQVNDTYGHQTGDDVLCRFAAGLRENFRVTDVIGRLGGDEYMVFMKDVTDLGLVQERAQRINAIFQTEPTYGVTVSVGIALYPSDGADFATLYRNVDEALYAVKKAGKQGYAFYREISLPPGGETS